MIDPGFPARHVAGSALRPATAIRACGWQPTPLGDHFVPAGTVLTRCQESYSPRFVACARIAATCSCDTWSTPSWSTRSTRTRRRSRWGCPSISSAMPTTRCGRTTRPRRDAGGGGRQQRGGDAPGHSEAGSDGCWASIRPATLPAARRGGRSKRWPAYFTAELAESDSERHGAADVVIANNVMANIDDLGDVVDGIRTLLAPDGVC